jgi:hypothetical protein
MEYAAGLTIVKTLGVDLTLSCLSSATSLIRLIGSIRSNDDSSRDIVDYIVSEDLEKQIGLIVSLIKNIDVNSEPLKICIGNLEECINSIEGHLKIFNERMSYNKSIWVLASLRSYGFADLLQKLRACAKTLESRIQFLFNVIQINHALEKK